MSPLHCTALYCTALHCTALHCTALYCTVLYCTALHCTALHCTALHCTALHCTEMKLEVKKYKLLTGCIWMNEWMNGWKNNCLTKQHDTCIYSIFWSRKRNQCERMPVNWNKANRTTGMTGALYAAEIVCICGMSRVHWSSRMAVMAGSGSS